MKHGCMVMTLRLNSSCCSGSSPKSPRPKKARQVRSNVKSMLIVFSDIRGIVHKEFLPPGQTVNGKFYCEAMKWPREGIQRKHPDKRKNKWFLHHDNAPAHTSLVIWQFPTSKNITVIPHHPIRLTLPPVTFSIPQDEIMAERALFWHDRGDPCRIRRGYLHTHIWEPPGMHEITENMLGSLYTCPRGLLQRRWWKLGVTVRNFYLMVKFPEFLGCTLLYTTPSQTQMF